MSNNLGPARRFLDLDELVRYVQGMPTLVNDLRSFNQKVDDGMGSASSSNKTLCGLA